MLFGGPPRVRKFGYVVLFTVFGTLPSSAQFEQFGQALGSTQGQQQSCNPNDPTCQPSANQNNIQIRNPSQTNQQQPVNPQIFVPGQLDNQNDTTNPQNGNRTQQLQLLHPR